MLPFFEVLEKRVKGAKDKGGFRVSAWPLFIAGFALLIFAFLLTPTLVELSVQLALFLAPLWLPAIIIAGAWTLWVTLIRGEYIAKQNYILLEIKLPRGHEKTPLAMEAVLSGLHLAPYEGPWYKKYWLGTVRPYWSLEIVSLEGQVHFFIWTRATFRKLIESNIYAQYPGAQVVEVQDYTRTISASHTEWAIWGCDYLFTNKDPYPIKTYVEYKLDSPQKEPLQIDPLANLIEFMGSAGKGEYLWLQMIIRVHKGEKYGKKMNAKGKQFTWRDEAKEIVATIRKETSGTYKDPATGEERAGFPNPTKGQAEEMAAIERNTSKLAFDVGIRGIYLAKPEKFDSININGLVGIFKQFSSEGWNGFRPVHWMTEFDDYPWEFGIQKLKDKYITWMVEAYRRRQYYHEPFDTTSSSMVMSTEELATIFHIPSSSVESPSLPRIQSSTSEAPVNLPT